MDINRRKITDNHISLTGANKGETIYKPSRLAAVNTTTVRPNIRTHFMCFAHVHWLWKGNLLVSSWGTEAPVFLLTISKTEGLLHVMQQFQHALHRSDWVFYRTIMGILIKPIGPHWYFKYFYFYQKIKKNDGRQYIFPRMFVEGSCVKLLQNQVSLNKTWHSTVRWTKSLPSNIGKLRNTSFQLPQTQLKNSTPTWSLKQSSRF